MFRLLLFRLLQFSSTVISSTQHFYFYLQSKSCPTQTYCAMKYTSYIHTSLQLPKAYPIKCTNMFIWRVRVVWKLLLNCIFPFCKMGMGGGKRSTFKLGECSALWGVCEWVARCTSVSYPYLFPLAYISQNNNIMPTIRFYTCPFSTRSKLLLPTVHGLHSDQCRNSDIGSNWTSALV